MARSFDAINYATRPNKAVERKMLVEAMHALQTKFAVNEYRYIGFGSMWFTDFILMHRALRITHLVSIEKDVSREDRAKFNRPFKCVEICMGDSAIVLPKLAWDKPTLCWLDYDTAIDVDVLADVERVCVRARSGSVLLVTVNADMRTLESDGKREPQDRANALKEIAEDAVPVDVAEINARNSGEVIAATLLNKMTHSVRNDGRSLQFVPLFNFAYSDGALMVSVGGIVLNEADAARFAETAVRQLAYVTAPEQYEIDVPHLTAREKLALDQRLPHAKSPKPNELKFTLPEKKIDAYRELYRFYPFFGELPL